MHLALDESSLLSSEQLMSTRSNVAEASGWRRDWHHQPTQVDLRQSVAQHGVPLGSHT